MATKRIDRIKQYEKEAREGGRRGSSSTSTEKKPLSRAERIKKFELEKEIDFDTFNRDLKFTGDVINNVYGNWQSERNLSDSKDQIRNMYKRIRAYQQYQSAYGGTDISDIVGGYKSVLGDWDTLTETYASYENADAYNKAMKQAKMDKDFAGLTYDEVQAKLKQYGEGTDEHKYLSNYTGYTSSEDFAKALDALGSGKGVSKNSHLVKENNRFADKIDENAEYRSALEKAKNIYELDHAGDSYLAMMEWNGFDEKSKYVPTKGTKDLLGYTYYEDDLYEYVNNPNSRVLIDLRENSLNTMAGAQSTGLTRFQKRNLDQMNDDERAIFNYLYQSDPNSAYLYLNEIQKMLDKRATDKTTGDVVNLMNENEFASFALSSVSPVLHIAGGIADTGDVVASTLFGKEYNPYGIDHITTNVKNTIREKRSEQWGESGAELPVIGNVNSFLYNTGMSMADSILGIATMGKLYTPLMGMSAYQQTSKELTDKGESADTAHAVALVSGIAEAGFEYIGVDNLFKIKNSDTLGNVLVNALKQAGAEGLEELGTESVNMLADTMFRGNNSELISKYNDLIKNGYSVSEANTEIAKEIGHRVAGAFLGGALSGGVMGGTYSGSQYHSLDSTGKQIRANNRVDDMWEISAMTPQESEAFNLYTEYANKGINAENISNAQLGNLYATTSAEADTALHSKKSSDVDKKNAVTTLSQLAKVGTAKAVIKSTGEAVNIESVKTVDGEQVLVTDKGEMSASDVTMSDNYTKLTEQANDMPEAMKQAFISNYDGASDVDTYKMAFELAYNTGQLQAGVDIAINSSRFLSKAQAEAIYEAGKNETIVLRQKQVDKIVSDYTSKKYIKGKVNSEEIANLKLTKAQQENVAVMNALFTGIGLDMRWTTKGEEEGYDGYYSRSKNEIVMDVYAGTSKNGIKDLDLAIAVTASHELSHWGEKKAPKAWSELADHVLESLVESGYGKGLTRSDLIAEEKKRIASEDNEYESWKDVPDDIAISELVARGCEEMLSMSDLGKDILGNLSEKEKKTIFEKVKEIFTDMINFIKDVLGRYKSNSREAIALRDNKARLEKQLELWEQMMREAMVTNQAMKEAGLTDKDLDSDVLGYEGLMYNRRLADSSHKENIQKNYSEDASVDLESLLKRYDAIIEIWDKLGAELDSQFLKDWDSKVGKDRNFTIFKAQAGYDYNVELSSMCKKGIPLFEAIDMIVQKEVLKKLKTDTIGKAEKQILYDILKKHHFEIPCAICYVEQARQREGDIINAFLNGKEGKKNGKELKLGWNKVLLEVQKEMKANGVDYTFPSVDRNISTDNYAPADISMDEETQDAFFDALKKIANEEIRRYNRVEKKNRKLVNEVTPEAIKSVFGGTLPSNLKIFKVLFNNPNSRFLIESDLLYSSATTQNLAKAHHDLYSLFNSQGGVSGYKTKQGTVVYWGDILGKNWDASKLRTKGGVRNQSNSDFMMYTLLDHAQMYIDFTAKGYYLQAYTKVIAELKLFGLSDGKINASFIPKVVEYKNADGTVDTEKTMENAGLDENGNPIYDDIEGVSHKEAFMLIEDENYSKSITGVCIGYSDKHIQRLLDDSRIQLIIGFHDKTNDGSKRYAGAKYAKNYNGINEATKISDGSTVHIGFNQFVKNAEKKFGYDEKNDSYAKETINYKGKTYAVNDIPRLATDLYLEHCEKKGLNPAYSQGGTDFSKHPNYYKLLADFGLYDSLGNYAPHKRVAYNMPKEVPYLDKYGNKAYMKTEDYIKQELQKELKVRDDIANALADESDEGIIPEFINTVNEAHSEKEVRLNKSRNLAPTFYSHMSNVVADIKQAKLGADSVIPYLKGKGVKAEEIKWSGIEEFLEGKKSVTKAELEEFVAGSMLQIEEETLGQNRYQKLESLLMKYMKLELEDYAYSNNTIDFDSLAVDIEEYYEDGSLTESQYDELYSAMDTASNTYPTRWHEYKLDGGENYRELLFKMPNSIFINRAMKVHWGKNGILAHARMQDFKDFDGNKMLFIEEIQSDWHNEGHKKGYLEHFVKASVDNSEIRLEGDTYYLYMNGVKTDYNMKEADAKSVGYDKNECHKVLVKIYNDIEDTSRKLHGVPDAPFRDNYHEYVLKRLIRMASEEGYDSIGWTTGQIQEDRWSSEYAEGYRIEYDQDIPKFLRKYGKKWGAEVGKKRIGASGGVFTLTEWRDSVLSNPLTTELVNTLTESIRETSGTTIGTRGVENEFFQILRHYAEYEIENVQEAIYRKFGHKLSHEEMLLVDKFIDDYDKVGTKTARSTEVWQMTITDAMRDSVLHEGQVMYKRRDSDSWLDALSIDDLLADLSVEELIDDEMFLDDVVNEELPQKKVRAKRRVDEVNKRLKALGLSFNGTKSLAWTDERIDKYLSGGYYGSSNPKYAQAYIAYVTPQQFLNLTVGDKNTTLDMIENESATYGDVDIQKLGNSAPLFLDIKEGRVWSQVTGHEGRHRMYLLGKAGFEKVPVLLFDYRTKYDKTAKDEMKLIAQNYSKDGLVSKSRNVVLKDVIPFSQGNRDLIIEKFGSGTEADIHYKKRDASIYDVMGESESLQKQNEILKADAERYKERLKLESKVTKGKVLDEKKLIATAKHLRNLAKSEYSETNIAEALREMHTKNFLWDDLMAKCYELAQNVLKDSKGYKVTNEYFKSVLADIRKARITLNDEQIQEAKNAFGENYRNAFMGRIMLVKDGTSLDQKWSEWSSMYPEIFDADLSPADQITALSDIYDSLRDGAEMYQKLNDEESIRAFAMEIYNKYWHLSTIRTIADKYDEKIKKLNFEHRKAMQELRNYYNNRLENQKKADAEYYGKIIRDLRNQRDERVKEAKELGRQRVNAVRDNVTKKNMVARIKKNIKILKEHLLKNSKDKHINEELKPMVRALVDAIDLEIKKSDVVAMEKAGADLSPTMTEELTLKDYQEAVANVRDNMKLLNALYKVKDSLDTAEFYGMGIEAEVESLVTYLEELRDINQYPRMVLNAMSIDQLNTVDKLVSGVKSVVMQANRLHEKRRHMEADSIGNEVTNFLDTLGKGKEYKESIAKYVKTFKWKNLVPYFAFKRLGKGGKVMFEILQDGWDKLAFNIRQILEFTDGKDGKGGAYTKDEVKKWNKEVKDIVIGGKKYKMTVPQIMSLYCLNKREQGRKHIYGFGIRVGTFDSGIEVVNQTENILVTEDDVNAILSLLTPRQKEVAEKIQEFMNRVCTEWGNYVSMERFGYKAFGEENYFPIEVDDNNLIKNKIKENQNTSLYALLNMGFSKSLNDNAKNAIIVNNIFDVFANHASEMAKYNALGLAVLDFNRIMNFSTDRNGSPYSLKTAMETAFGKDAEMYFNKLIADLNGTQNVSRDVIGKGAMAKAKLGAIGWNIKTILLQPTAYFKAIAVIDKRYLFSPVVLPLVKRGIERSKKYCGMALWKSLGFYDTNISRGVVDKIKHEESLMDILAEKSTKGMEKADAFTIGLLWNACELEMTSKRKDLKDDAFYEAVANRLREVIYATQVVDSTLTRSEMMRSGDGKDKMLTAFMSEPTLAYNMLLDAVMETSLLKRSGASKEALQKNRRKVARVLDAYIATNIVTAVVEAFITAFRDDDDELEEGELEKMMLENFVMNMGVIGKIPYLKDVVSLASGYSPSRIDLQGVQSLVYAFNSLKKNLQGEGNVATTIKHSLKGFSSLSGLAFFNAYRDIMALLDFAGILSAEELEELLNEIIE